MQTKEERQRLRREYDKLPKSKALKRAQSRKYYLSHLAEKKEYENRPEVKARKRVSDRKYYLEHTEKILAKNKEYMIEHKEEMTVAKKKWVENNRDRVRATKKRWKLRNRGKVNADKMKRIATQLNLTPPWVDHKEIEEFYILARKMTEETGITHHVDHIYPLNGEIANGLHVPWNLQVLTESENCSKGNRV